MSTRRHMAMAFCLSLASLAAGLGWWRNERLTSDYAGRFGTVGHLPRVTATGPGTASFLCRDGSLVGARIRVPSASPPPWRAVVLMGGLGTGARAAALVPDRFVESGTLVLSLDYHLGRLPRPGRRATWWDYLRYPDALEATVNDLIDAAEWLAARPDVDPERIALVGVSFGMVVAPAAAAAQRRYRALALVYGGAPLGRLAEHNLTGLPSCLRPVVGDLADVLLAPVEPLRHLPRLGSRPVLYMASMVDEQIPPDAVVAVRDAIPGPLELRLLDTRHIDPGNTELIGELTGGVMDWLGNVLPPGR